MTVKLFFQLLET